jgi:hypothetical protein
MLLFLTRDAFCRRSIEERRVGEGDPDLVPKGVFSELKPRFCQKRRGDVVLLSSGDDWKGDEPVSVFKLIFWETCQQECPFGQRDEPGEV